jgi:polyketide biosynthesis enoyl-CoA hydratase PksI
MDEIASTVVRMTESSEGVCEIVMQDKATKNSLTPLLMNSLTDAFQRAVQNEATKVIILTGYDTYFLSGGTKEELLHLQSGELDTAILINFLRLMVECPVPVIAAMQGHGIGAGFVFGLHADLIVLARESIYTTNFLRYGFTPGMGATLVLPAKFGPMLAHEMLFTARNYRGGELAQRGVTCPVLPRQEVLPHARRMAGEIASAPRSTLLQLKKLLTAAWRPAFLDRVTKEMEMLTQTIQQPDIVERIQARYGQ